MISKGLSSDIKNDMFTGLAVTAQTAPDLSEQECNEAFGNAEGGKELRSLTAAEDECMCPRFQVTLV